MGDGATVGGTGVSVLAGWVGGVTAGTTAVRVGGTAAGGDVGVGVAAQAARTTAAAISTMM
ncbi:MAG TPA: hypothetical protein VFS21_15425 [Roseiflexaceae bacterium]|nr:hypothetical protein [Roseiflexaceae bacterium]